MGFLKKRLAEAPIPGVGTVSLPAGTVTINYEEKRMGRGVGHDTSANKRWPGIPSGVDVSIRAVLGGQPLAIEAPRGSHEYSTLKLIGSRYGRVEIPVAGDYVVTVAPFNTQRELFEPHLSFKG